jgi:hypothetical protein
MIHYTLNTDHSRVSPRSEVRDELIVALRRMLRDGRHKMLVPMDAYEVQVNTADGGLMATVYRGADPLVTFAVAQDAIGAAELWPVLTDLYYRLTDMRGMRTADFAAAHEPKELPWCAAVTILPTPDEAAWIADFERCLAWAFLDRTK